mmetsp:Transcript_13928/g.29401  ORF Transcript_13928/g.29401 Transcript_13928/m.29401 type:complete len:80 (+) Transcript_13928:399-638(+)
MQYCCIRRVSFFVPLSHTHTNLQVDAIVTPVLNFTTPAIVSTFAKIFEPPPSMTFSQMSFPHFSLRMDFDDTGLPYPLT